MSISLVTKYAPYTDEVFAAESKRSLLTNNDFDWTGAKSVKIWQISTSAMHDYGRTGAAVGDISRFGPILDLSAQTQEMMLDKDRSFIFNIDRLDEDETAGQLAAASALARQIREVVIPEIDAHCYSVMCDNAGTKPAPEILANTIYGEIMKAGEVLDNALVPDTNRFIIMTPKNYAYLKNARDSTGAPLASAFLMETDIGQDMRIRGAIAMVDGATVIRVPEAWLPENFGFMMCHPSATVSPVKLEDFGMHPNTPLSSGTIVTGRVCYDTFVLDNKKMGIYYQPIDND